MISQLHTLKINSRKIRCNGELKSMPGRKDFAVILGAQCDDEIFRAQNGIKRHKYSLQWT